MSDEPRNVVDLHTGQTPIEAREPYPPLVAMLEEQLERARSGEIQGMCTSYLYHDGTGQFWNVSRRADYALIGAAESSKAAMALTYVKACNE